MTPALAQEILEYAYGSDKPLYRAILTAVAEARHLRPAFFEKKPRAERHTDMLGMLSRPRLEEAGANLLRTWLLKSQTAMLGDFLDGIGVTHDKGVVSDFPATVEDAKLAAAVEALLSKHPREKVAVYLNTITATSGVNWPNLETMLQNDTRLQLA